MEKISYNQEASNIDRMEPKRLKVSKVESFGLFLEDGGFIHISKISKFHKNTSFQPGELNDWYPKGSEIIVKLEKEEKLPDGTKRVYYDFIKPGNIIDI